MDKLYFSLDNSCRTEKELYVKITWQFKNGNEIVKRQSPFSENIGTGIYERCKYICNAISNMMIIIYSPEDIHK